MRIFFKNLGVVFIFIGIIPIILIISEGFKTETLLMAIFSIALGTSLFIINKD